MRSIVLLSGGLDSTYYAYKLHHEGDILSFLFFDYGQRNHAEEYASASLISDKLKGSFERIDLSNIVQSLSPLVQNYLPTPQYKNMDQINKELAGRLEPAFVAMRNPIFLTIALNRAAAWNYDRVCIGITKEDITMPDCTPQFLEYFTHSCSEALASDTPKIESLVDFSKKDMILDSLNIPDCYLSFSFTHTSYDNRYPPIRDHASVEREAMFDEAGIPDPLIIRAFSRGLLPFDYFYKYKDAKWYPSFLRIPSEGEKKLTASEWLNIMQEFRNTLVSLRERGEL